MNNPKIREKDMHAMLDIPSIYCDRSYITVDGDMMRFTFCEAGPELGDIKPRVAISMTTKRALDIHNALGQFIEALKQAQQKDQEKLN